MARDQSANVFSDRNSVGEEPMRYCLVLLPLLVVGCADTYDNGYTYRGDAYAYRGDA